MNDVELVWEAVGDGPDGAGQQREGAADGCRLTLRIAEVEVGTRGAVRRLLKGLPASDGGRSCGAVSDDA